MWWLIARFCVVNASGGCIPHYSCPCLCRPQNLQARYRAVSPFLSCAPAPGRVYSPVYQRVLLQAMPVTGVETLPDVGQGCGVEVDEGAGATANVDEVCSAVEYRSVSWSEIMRGFTSKSASEASAHESSACSLWTSYITANINVDALIPGNSVADQALRGGDLKPLFLAKLWAKPKTSAPANSTMAEHKHSNTLSTQSYGKARLTAAAYKQRQRHAPHQMVLAAYSRNQTSARPRSERLQHRSAIRSAQARHASKVAAKRARAPLAELR